MIRENRNAFKVNLELNKLATWAQTCCWCLVAVNYSNRSAKRVGQTHKYNAEWVLTVNILKSEGIFHAKMPDRWSIIKFSIFFSLFDGGANFTGWF